VFDPINISEPKL